MEAYSKDTICMKCTCYWVCMVADLIREIKGITISKCVYFDLMLDLKNSPKKLEENKKK